MLNRYELTQKGILTEEDVGVVPDIYLRNQQMDDNVKYLRTELDKACYNPNYILTVTLTPSHTRLNPAQHSTIYISREQEDLLFLIIWLPPPYLTLTLPVGSQDCGAR